MRAYLIITGVLLALGCDAESHYQTFIRDSGTEPVGPDVDATVEPRLDASAEPTPSRGVAASYYPEAAAVGRDVLAAGGNAADATFAMAFMEYVLTPGVTSPAGNFGALVYDAATGSIVHLDGEYNDVLAADGEYVPGDPLGKTVVVFGSVAALFAMLERYGSIEPAQLLAPAIQLAEEGFMLNQVYADILYWRGATLRRSEYGENTFFRFGSSLPSGQQLRLPEVAAFLRGLADFGVDYMYRGAWAEQCVAAVQEAGGRLALEDLDSYEAKWRTPLHTQYRGFDVYGSRGRFYGGPIAQFALEALEHGHLSAEDAYSTNADDLGTLIQLMRLSLFETWFYDPQVLDHDEVLLDHFSESHTRAIWDAAQLGPTDLTTDARGSHSTSLGVADSSGNIVIATHSINSLPFGEGIFVQGIPLTAGGSWTSPSGPGERRISPLSHHIVLKDGHVRFAASSWNGSLVEAEFQFLVQAMDYGLGATEIAIAPRFGTFPFSYSDFERDYRSNWLDPRIDRTELEARGFVFSGEGFLDTGLGTIITINEANELEAANASVGGDVPAGVALFAP